MFKEFNKEFYRSLNFYLMIMLLLGSVGEWLNKGPSLWLGLLLFASVGTARSAFWSKEWMLRAICKSISASHSCLLGLG